MQDREMKTTYNKSPQKVFDLMDSSSGNTNWIGFIAAMMDMHGSVPVAMEILDGLKPTNRHDEDWLWHFIKDKDMGCKTRSVFIRKLNEFYADAQESGRMDLIDKAEDGSFDLLPTGVCIFLFTGNYNKPTSEMGSMWETLSSMSFVMLKSVGQHKLTGGAFTIKDQSEYRYKFIEAMSEPLEEMTTFDGTKYKDKFKRRR